MSDFDLDAFLRSVHGKPQEKTVRFDKDKFAKALRASFADNLPGYTRGGQSLLVVYTGELDLVRIAKGIAVASTQPAALFTLASDELQRGQTGILLKPLKTGQTVVL